MSTLSRAQVAEEITRLDLEVKWKALELEVRRALCLLMIEEPDLEEAINILVDALD